MFSFTRSSYTVYFNFLNVQFLNLISSNQIKCENKIRSNCINKVSFIMFFSCKKIVVPYHVFCLIMQSMCSNSHSQDFSMSDKAVYRLCNSING